MGEVERAEMDSEQGLVTSRSGHLSAGDIRQVLELHDRGVTQVEIAKVINCAQATVSRTLKAFNADSKAVARQLRTLTDEAIDDWRSAKRVAAARGDHRPAKELIEMAHAELRSTAGHGAGGGGVTVIVAVPGGERNPLPTIEVSPAKAQDAGRKVSESLAITPTSHNDSFVNQGNISASAVEVTRYSDESE